MTPANKLTAAERDAVLDRLNSNRFVDQAPLEVYAQLLDDGTYLCSVSTMYRILREDMQVADRRRQARHPARVRPELVATAPRQVYTWDITKLPGPVKGTYYGAYVMIDIYSRYIVGAHMQTHESGLLAVEFMRKIFAVYGIPNVVHADRGTSMTSKTVATLLADLEVTRSHSRPRVSNDCDDRLQPSRAGSDPSQRPAFRAFGLICRPTPGVVLGPASRASSDLIGAWPRGTVAVLSARPSGGDHRHRYDGGDSP